MSSGASSQTESWESEMSESVAHLVTAYASVRETSGGASMEPAPRSIHRPCVAKHLHGDLVNAA